MQKNIVVINGHPSKTSLNMGLVEAYVKGAREAGHHVEELVLADMHFDPILRHGYQKRMELEPDLLQAWEKIKWAQHLVWVHPVWWGSMPALMKGFIDRLFLPGMAFKPRENSVWWDKLLTGRSAHIITTLDQPGWYYWLVYGRPSINQLKRTTLNFCGIRPVQTTYIGIVKGANEQKRKLWVQKVYELGRKV